MLVISCSKDNPTKPDNIKDEILWKTADSPIFIDSCFVVSERQTLTIEPGVEVRFKSSNNLDDFYYESLNVGMLYIKGELIAEGTVSDSIIFTCDNYNWGVIYFDSTSVNVNSMKYCKIDHAFLVYRYGYNHLPNLDGSISCYKSQASINNCKILDNWNGIFCYNSNSNITNNIIINNYVSAIMCNNSNPTINYNHIENNSQGIRCSYDSNSIISNNC